MKIKQLFPSHSCAVYCALFSWLRWHITTKKHSSTSQLSTVWLGGRGWVSFARKFAIHTLHTICNLSCSWHWFWFRPVDFSIPYTISGVIKYHICIWSIGNSFGVPMPGPSYADLCGSDDCPGVPVVKVIFYQLLHNEKYIYCHVPPQVVTISVGVFAVLLLCQLCWFCCRYYRN